MSHPPQHGHSLGLLSDAALYTIAQVLIAFAQYSVQSTARRISCLCGMMSWVLYA